MIDLSDIQIWPLKNDHPTIKANGSLVIDKVFKLKFVLRKGPTGLFVGFPGKFGDKVDENGKKTWYADVTCIDKEVVKQVNETVIAAYNKKTGNTLNQSTISSMDQSAVDDNIPF